MMNTVGIDVEVIRRIQKEQRLQRLSTATLVLFAAALFALLIYGLYKINVVVIPKPIMDIFLSAAGKDAGGDRDYNDQLLNLLKNRNGAEFSVKAYNIDRLDESEYLEILKAAPNLDRYYVTQRVSYYSGGTRMTRSKSVWVNGDKYRVDTYAGNIPAGNVPVESISYDGANVYIMDYSTYDFPVVRKLPPADDFSYASGAGLPEIRAFADPGNIAGLEITVERTDKSNMYHIVYGYGNIPDQREELYVSVEYGIILQAETYYGGALVYRMETLSVVTSAVSDPPGGYVLRAAR